MYSLDELTSLLYAHGHGLILSSLSKFDSLYSILHPALAESIARLPTLPTFDREQFSILWERDWFLILFSPLASLLSEIKSSVPTTLGIAILGLVSLSLLYSLRSRSPSVGPQDVHEPLIALMAILAPTTSIWPATYLHIARRGVRSRKYLLVLPFRALYDDYIGGNLELRSSTSDLPTLMMDTYQYQDWKIRLSAQTSWWLHALLRISLARLACLLPRPRPVLRESICALGFPRNQLEHSANTVAALHKHACSIDPALQASHVVDNERIAKQTLVNTCLLRNAATGGRATLILDAVPYSRVHAYIRAFQLALPPDAPVMFGFSTLGSSVSLFSTRFVMATVPFLFRKYVTKRQFSSSNDRPYSSACRTVTPLMTSLDSILKALTSGPAPFVIESVQNVSDQYANYLRQHVQDLTDDSAVRARFFGRWGVEGWREERFIVTWEESLCRAGLLARWLILAHK